MKHQTEHFRFGRSIQYLARQFQRLADDNLSKEGLTLVQLRVIAAISKSGDTPVYQKDLERLLSVRRSSVTSLLQNMEKSGLILRAGHGEDKRMKVLTLSEKGRRLDERLKTFIFTLEEGLMQGFSQKERDEFSSYLLRLNENLDVIERSRV